MKIHSKEVFPARLAIGDACTLNLGTGVDPIPGQIVGVGFNESKVLYDVAIILDGEPYLVYPLREVDSIFCSPLGDSSSFPCPTGAVYTVAASSLFSQFNHVVEKIMASKLDEQIKNIRQQLQDAKRTGDRDWADELQQELNDLQHQQDGEQMKASTIASRILVATDSETPELVDQGEQGTLEAAYEGSKTPRQRDQRRGGRGRSGW
jgi:hypothetical protein